MVKKKPEKKTKPVGKQVSKKTAPSSAIVALVLNIILPGLGSVIADRTKTGIHQLILMAIALATTMFFTITVFYVIWAVAWIWALITGIQLIKAS